MISQNAPTTIYNAHLAKVWRGHGMNEHGLGKGNEGATNPVESIIRVMMMAAMRLSVCVSVSLSHYSQEDRGWKSARVKSRISESPKSRYLELRISTISINQWEKKTDFLFWVSLFPLQRNNPTVNQYGFGLGLD